MRNRKNINSDIHQFRLQDGSILGVTRIKFYSYATSALINDDTSGLSEEDEKDLDQWLVALQEYATDNGFNHAEVVSCDDTTEFGYPHLVSGLRGDIVNYTVHFYTW